MLPYLMKAFISCKLIHKTENGIRTSAWTTVRVAGIDHVLEKSHDLLIGDTNLVAQMASARTTIG
jgi:hypothetical protein